MSLLRRTGTSRNNIEWYSSTNSSGQYLQRISTNRNDISFIQISSNGTYNLLNRISNGINDIQWKNTTFSFSGNLTKVGSLIQELLNCEYTTSWIMFTSERADRYHTMGGRRPTGMSYTKNTVSWQNNYNGTGISYNDNLTGYYFGFSTTTSDNADMIANELMKFNKFNYYNTDYNIIKNKQIWQHESIKYRDGSGVVRNGHVGLVQINRIMSFSKYYTTITFS